MVAPLPVREFTSVAEMMAHYALVQRRCFDPVGAAAEAAAQIAAREVVPAEADRYRDIRPPTPPDESFRVSTQRQVQGTAQFSGIEILITTARATGFTRKDLCGEKRTLPLAKARHIGMWLMYRHCGFSLPEIGRKFGGKDHTTVLHAVRKVDAVAAQLGLAIDGEPADVGAALWSADWPRPKRKGAAA